MGKIAFVFSGQGDQKVGMCRDLFDANPIFKEEMQSLDKIHPGLIDSIYSGSDEELMKTINTQPALYAIETSLSKMLDSVNIKADVVAGFSLGEIAALSYAGSFSDEEGMQIVSKRAEYMQREAEKFDAVMTAVLRLDQDKVNELAQKYEFVFPVNFNCPSQIVCSGLESEIKEFEADVKNAGGRALRLSVKGAFHSPFMREASDDFRTYLDTVEVDLPRIDAYSNYLGDIYKDSVKDTLALQIKSPVLWQNIVEKMISRGVDTFIEIGPGSTLANLIKKINKDVRVFTSGSLDGFDKIKEELC